jgi:hypothetical protein
MERPTSLSRSASSSSSGKQSGDNRLTAAVCVPQAHSISQRPTHISEAVPLMLRNFPPPRSYGSLLTYYRFIRNGSVIGSNQVLILSDLHVFLLNLFLP